MAGTTDGYAPHPYIGGRTAVLRALAAWRMEWPGTPRVLVLTGDPGSGRSHLITGFLMLCDPEYRKRLPLADLDPSTVPPDLPAPAVPGAAGLTATQVIWLLADHLGLVADEVSDVFSELACLSDPVTVVVPDVDRDEPCRVDLMRPSDRESLALRVLTRTPPSPETAALVRDRADAAGAATQLDRSPMTVSFPIVAASAAEPLGEDIA